MGDVDVAQLARDIGRGAAEAVGGVAIGAARQQHARRRQQGMHGAGMQCGDAALIGMLHPRAGFQQHRHQRADVGGIAVAAGAQLRAEQQQQRRLALVVGVVHVGAALEQGIEQAARAQAVVVFEAELRRRMQRVAAARRRRR